MISKSLLGTTWKPITQMTAAEKTVLRHSRSHYFATGKGQRELAKETKPRTIPTKAVTQGKGKVRVTGYEGDGRFTAVTNRDEKIVRSRDAYKFQKGLPSALKPHVWSEDARALHSAFPSTTKAARVARGAIKSGADDPKALKAASKAEPKGAYILSRLESKRLGDIAGMRGNINRKSDIQAGRAVRRSVQKNAFGVTDARSK